MLYDCFLLIPSQSFVWQTDENLRLSVEHEHVCGMETWRKNELNCCLAQGAPGLMCCHSNWHHVVFKWSRWFYLNLILASVPSRSVAQEKPSWWWSVDCDCFYAASRTSSSLELHRRFSWSSGLKSRLLHPHVHRLVPSGRPGGAVTLFLPYRTQVCVCVV